MINNAKYIIYVLEMQAAKIYYGIKFLGDNVNIDHNDSTKTLSFNMKNNVLEFDISSITGIQQQYYPHSTYSEVILEISRINKTPFRININSTFGIPSQSYLRLILSHETMIKLFSKSGVLGRYDNIIKKSKEGLPSWFNKVPFLGYKLRKFIQFVIIVTELCLYCWTLYQLAYKTPGITYFFEMAREYVGKILSPSLNIFWLILYPMATTYLKIENYIKILLQIKILSMIQLEFIWDTMRKALTYTHYIRGLLVIPLYKFNKLNIFSETKGTIPLHKKIFEILWNMCRYIWDYIIKPVKHMYVLIITPLSGELGRKINNLDNTKNKLKEKDKK